MHTFFCQHFRKHWIYWYHRKDCMHFKLYNKSYETRRHKFQQAVKLFHYWKATLTCTLRACQTFQTCFQQSTSIPPRDKAIRQKWDCPRRSGLPTTFKIMSDLPVHCKVCPIHQVFHCQILKTYLTTQLRCLEAEGEKNTKWN